MTDEKNIDYQDRRDVLYVFGAGASVADGSPLQTEILQLIYNEDFGSSGLSALVKDFITENFDLTGDDYPSLEAVFGYLDYFICKKESLGGNYTTKNLILLKEALIRLIHYCISKSNNTRGTYQQFWETVNKTNKNISIITLNYDTLLEDAFSFLYPYDALIDYCINFMNYDNANHISAFDWWVDPRKPVTIWNGKTPTPIKIIKIHGSLNWKYCNCCNQVLLTPFETSLDVDSQCFKGRTGESCDNLNEIVFDLKCPNDNTLFDTFIVPPSHIKELNHPAISKLFDEAAIEIRKAKKIVFIGYSFPEADVHIKALFRKNLTASTDIVVVDPNVNNRIKSNFRSINKSASFIKNTFENYIKTEMNITNEKHKL